LPDAQAILLVGPRGPVDQIVYDRSLNLRAIAEEYATLLRVARSASEDSGAGNLLENILVSEKQVIITRTLQRDHHLILFARAHDPIGRSRYRLKHAAWEIGKALQT
jgi:predicted regulator of Ras-like GTPase activity (Roadblock/LC7/MglB family)